MNSNTRQSCTKDERRMVNMINNEDVIQEISKKNNLLKHNKKLAKEEDGELKNLKQTLQSIIDKLSPIQSNYKLSKEQKQ